MSGRNTEDSVRAYAKVVLCKLQGQIVEEVLDLMMQQVEYLVLVVQVHLNWVKSMSQMRFF